MFLIVKRFSRLEFLVVTPLLVLLFGVVVLRRANEVSQNRCTVRS